MRSEQAREAGEVLLRRLRRLVTRAGTVKGGDRKQLLALIDDVEATRRGLLEQRGEVEDEIRQATVRTNAIGAYLRNAQSGRGKRHN